MTLTLATLLLSAVVQTGPLACAEGPIACEPTACTEYTYVEASGYLYCQDAIEFWASDDMTADDQLGAFPPGHWRFVEGEKEDEELNLMSFGYADVEY